MANKRTWLVAGFIVVLVAGLHMAVRGQFKSGMPLLAINLTKPDAYIQSQQLSALPADLVSMPGLKAVLTQEFVNYYEEHPDRLSLEGTLRRLAFEHQLSWQEKLISRLLDAPAEMALWRDGKGRLSYFALVVQKNLAAGVIEQLAKVTLTDQQLSRAGEIQVNGSAVVVYALTLRKEKTWLVASYKDQLLLLNHPGMLLQEGGGFAPDSADTIKVLLDKSVNNPWKNEFHLAKTQANDVARHTAVVKSSFLSFGYQYFFPEMYALQLQINANATWKIQAAAAPKAWTDWSNAATHAWSVLPRGAAFCAALPVNWMRAEPALQVALGSAAKTLVSDLEPGAGVCWYANAGLYAPMVAARLKPGNNSRHDANLKILISQVLAASPPIKDVATKKITDQDILLTKDIANPDGYLKNKEGPVHRVGVARLGTTLIASVDHRMVEQSVAVKEKTYPALADEYPQTPVLISQWPEVARLLETESLRLATRATTPLFNAVSREQLKPRLDALARNGNLILSAPSKSVSGQNDKAWLWQPLAITLSDASRK
jgi:uncharacterized protein YfaA (DUF2138 family)